MNEIINLKVLFLTLTLADKTKVLPKDKNNSSIDHGFKMILKSCPKDGPLVCDFWKWKQVSKTDIVLALSSTRHNVHSHPYGKNSKFITFSSDSNERGIITELLLDDNEFSFFPDYLFKSILRVVSIQFHKF